MNPETPYNFDPLTDDRWLRLVEGHPRATVFHTRGWLDALRRTYGYRPVAFTGSAPGEELRNALVFCRVESWLTGRRLVSLPFTDHCEPLAESPAGETAELLAGLVRGLSFKVQGSGEKAEGGRENTEDRRRKATGGQAGSLSYVEVRPLGAEWVEGLAEVGFGVSQEAYFHELDLSPGSEALLAGFSRDSVRRKISRAVRERLNYREGRTPELLRDFFRLQLITRRRQGVPPQPIAWFENLASCLGKAMKVRVAYQGRRPLAAIVTLSHRDRVVYKYGASDVRFNHLGGTQLLFWRTIEEACLIGARVFDLGRCDLDNQGLATFKERWGTRRSTIRYYRFPAPGAVVRSSRTQPLLRRMPLPVLRVLGRLAYRHVG